MSQAKLEDDVGQPPQKRELDSHNALDLTIQAKKYAELLEQLNEVVVSLHETHNKNIAYGAVAQSALDLYDQLTAVGADFFNKIPTAKRFEKFKTRCNDCIKTAEGEFGTHRDFWYLSVHPIVRAILGILAILAIIPALLVSGFSTHGYYDTFFGAPLPKSLHTLAKMTSDLDDINVEVANRIKHQ